VAKGPYSSVARLAQKATHFAGRLIVVDGQALELGFVPTSFRPPTNRTEPVLLNEHRLVGAQRDPVVDCPLEV
jgi:hypothetical protein